MKAVAEHFVYLTKASNPFLTMKVDQLISNKDVFILERLAAEIFRA